MSTAPKNAHSLADFVYSKEKGKPNVTMSELAFPDISKGICSQRRALSKEAKVTFQRIS